MKAPQTITVTANKKNHPKNDQNKMKRKTRSWFIGLSENLECMYVCVCGRPNISTDKCPFDWVYAANSICVIACIDDRVTVTFMTVCAIFFSLSSP